MTAHHCPNTAQAKQPCAESPSNFTCVEADQLVMVAQQCQTELPKDAEIHVESWSEGTASIASRGSFEEECRSESGMEVTTPDQSLGNFGNIVVKNSSEVQFGNNTYYQGPVVIKQFMYNNGADDPKLCVEDGVANLTYSVSDDNDIKVNDSECVKIEQDYNKKTPNGDNKITTNNQGKFFILFFLVLDLALLHRT